MPTFIDIIAGVAQQQVSGGGGAFDPLSYGSPVHAFWAEDPSWTDPGDGNIVTSWRNDGSNGTAVTPGASGPVYRSSTTKMNSKATVEFDGVNDYLAMAEAAATVSQAGTMVVVFNFDSIGAGDNVVSGRDATARWMIDAASTTSLRIYAGTVLGSTTIAAGTTYVAVAKFDGASSNLRINGSSVLSGNAGTWALEGLMLAANTTPNNDYMDGHIGYVAVFGSDITGESWFSEYEDGLATHYGA